jgi:hypothetical protein
MIRDVVTRGFGGYGSGVSFVVTRGYSVGVVTVSPPGGRVVVAFVYVPGAAEQSVYVPGGTEVAT